MFSVGTKVKTITGSYGTIVDPMWKSDSLYWVQELLETTPIGYTEDELVICDYNYIEIGGAYMVHETEKQVRIFKNDNATKIIPTLDVFLNTARIAQYFIGEMPTYDLLHTDNINKINNTCIVMESDYIIIKSRNNPFLVVNNGNTHNIIRELLLFDDFKDALTFIYGDIEGTLLLDGYYEVLR